jgi:hypothetical protein
VPATRGSLRATGGRGGPKVGPWCAMPSTQSVEALARARFDRLIFDLQRGLISLADLPTLMPAAACSGVPAIIRVQWKEPAPIILFNGGRRHQLVRYPCTSRAQHSSRGSLRGRDPRCPPRISATAPHSDTSTTCTVGRRCVLVRQRLSGICRRVVLQRHQR